MTDTKPRRQRRPICLACDRPASANAFGETNRRGLCTGCYAAFDRKRGALPTDERDGYEERLIDDGLLLPTREPSLRSPFHRAEQAAAEDA